MNTRSSELEFRAPRDDAELAAFRDILERCFDTEPERAEKWMASSGAENMRVLKGGNEVLAGLLYVDMGQFFGGRAVPTAGVAAVGVPPEHRGGGMALELMSRAMREMRSTGRPLSTLYPATYTLYRRAGYEGAGCLFRSRIACAELRGFRGKRNLRRITEADHPRIEATYMETARTRPGYLARGSYVWNRVRGKDAKNIEGYLVEQAGEVWGYLFLVRVKGDGHDFDLALTDLVARDEAAARQLLGMLGSHSSIAGELRWREGPGSPFVALLRERSLKLELDHIWMLRVIDVEQALKARGYPISTEAELQFELTDELLPENAGSYTLRVARGEARIERGGRAELSLSARGLASLYSGFQSAESLATCGRAQGSEQTLQLATALFAGPAPGMPDMF